MLKTMHILTPVNKVTKKLILKFNVGDCMRISKCKNIFVKSYTLNQFEEVFGNKKVENTVPWTIVISDLIDEEIIGMFYKKELQKTNQTEFRVEKVPKRNNDKLYFKWKGNYNSVHSQIDQKDVIVQSE